MALSEQQRQTFDDMFEPAKVDIDSSLQIASQRDPDAYAESLKLADSQQLPVDTVERNVDEVRRREKLRTIDSRGLSDTHPKTAEFLSNPDNATLALDDLDVLKGLEDVITSKERTWGEFAADTGIDLGKGVVGLGESIVGLLDLATFNKVGEGLEAIGYDPGRTNQILSEFYSKKRERANQRVQEAEGFIGTLGALVDNPSAAFGTVVESTPMMVGIMAATRVAAAKLLASAGIAAGTAEATAFLLRPDIVARLATMSAVGEGALQAGSAQETARQAGRTWSESVLPSLASGAGTALIGKFSSKILPDVEATTAAVMMSGETARKSILEAGKTVAKGMFKEGVLEELPQSAQEAIWENIALGRPWDTGVGEAAAQGLIAGAGMGGGMTFTTELSAAFNTSRRQGEVAVESLVEQQKIDQIIKYSQDSTLRGRSSERMAEFLKAVDPDRQIFIPADIASQMKDAPSYVTDQIDGSGIDVAIPVDRFTTDIAPNTDVMELLRPHLKLNPSSLSINDMQQDDTSVRSLLERAQRAQDVKSEADQIYQQVKDQIVGTDRQSESTARLSAQIIPAYVATKAERLSITPREVYERMGLKIVGPVTPEPQAATTDVIMDQPIFSKDQDFSGVQLTEDVVIEETGKTATITQDAQILWDRTHKRRNVIEQLRNCLRG